MSERQYFVLRSDNCRFEGMTKEQIYDAIAEATGSTPTPVDEAFITKIKEQNAEHSLKMWKGTEAQFNALEEKDADTVYLVGTNIVEDYSTQIGVINNALENKASLNHNHDLRYYKKTEIDSKLYFEQCSIRITGDSEADEIIYDNSHFSRELGFAVIDARVKFTGFSFNARTPVLVGEVDGIPNIGHNQSLVGVEIQSSVIGKRKAMWNAFIYVATNSVKKLYLFPNIDVALGDTDSVTIQINGTIKLV